MRRRSGSCTRRRGVDDGAGFFSTGLGEMSRSERLAAVGAMEGLSIVRQCALAGAGRSSVYYIPAGESEANLALMRRMDELHTAYPFYGVRQMCAHLRLESAEVNAKRVRRLMRLMGIRAARPPPRTSAAGPGHRVHPYLLRGMDIVEADQVWCADITYIPVKSGFFYLVAVMDWATRHVLSWRLSNTVDVGFCLEALEDALLGGTPGIFNTDQGSQFTSEAFTGRVLAAGAKMSMDGRGRYLDNIFIERLWRSLKYECVYLHELEDGRHARELIGAWLDFYNHVRPHSALGGRTPASVCLAGRASPSGALAGAAPSRSPGNTGACRPAMTRVNFISRGRSVTGAHLISALELSREWGAPQNGSRAQLSCQHLRAAWR